jgi:hypothetical protein
MLRAGASAQYYEPFKIERSSQEERGRAAEEAATLRGSAAALEAQLTAAQAARGSVESAASSAHADASALRADLQQARALHRILSCFLVRPHSAPQPHCMTALPLHACQPGACRKMLIILCLTTQQK